MFPQCLWTNSIKSNRVGTAGNHLMHSLAKVYSCMALCLRKNWVQPDNRTNRRDGAVRYSCTKNLLIDLGIPTH